MVNPLLTIAFDILVIGGTAALFLAAIAEARMDRRGVVAVSRPVRRRNAVRPMTTAGTRAVRVRRRLAA